MNFKYYFILLSINVIFIKSICCLVDPITIGAVAIIGGIGYFFTKSVTKEGASRSGIDYCRYYECCDNYNIMYDIDGLKEDLKKNLFGQHIVNETLIPALKSHHKNLYHSQKPLVMSFHGTPGTGKNYVADRIVEHLYRKGDDSKYVHKFRGRVDFPLASEVNTYRVQLKEKIVHAVKQCSRSIFVFDEVDKMPEGVFESITSLLDHHKTINGVNFRQAIFIFLSNAGGMEISHALEDLMLNGKYREQTAIYDFEKIAEIGAYNVNGGLKNTGLITSSLIDHFIPFLPLEKRHVEKCVQKDFQRLGKVPTEQQINEIANNYVSYHGKFSVFGCKRINKKVAVMAEEW